MHKTLPKIFYFIDQFDFNELKRTNKSTAIIYRNYHKKVNEKTILLIKNYCFNNGQKFFLANNIKIAAKLKLDGVYIPAFNKLKNTKNYTLPKKFIFIGSAHNQMEIKIKEKQGCKLIFLAPVFKVLKKKDFLDVAKFNNLSKNSSKKIIALGGINKNNLKKINLLNCFGISGISWIKKNGPSKLGPLLNFLNLNN
jgi:thiamine-phosphate pyrophosphorylase